MRISGSETISMSGLPQRFTSKSESASWSCTSLPASSSIWTRLTRIDDSRPSTTIGSVPDTHIGMSNCDI
ncbi:hypothetical protein R80B4_02653 [Fibrobacteres bacterium R8-0-B4]